MPKIPAELLVDRINGYSDSGLQKKTAFHKAGRKFLQELAAELGLVKGAYDLRSNKGGAAVSGEVTLHGDAIYVQLFESTARDGVRVLYRGCKGRADFSGGQNNEVMLSVLAISKGVADRFMERCRAMVVSDVYIARFTDAKRFIGQQVFWGATGGRFEEVRTGILQGISARTKELVISGDWVPFSRLTNLRNFRECAPRSQRIEQPVAEAKPASRMR